MKSETIDLNALPLGPARPATPWGTADFVTTYAPGIEFYTTPRHGGFLLGPERWAEFQAALPGWRTWAGGQWFEEDMDAAAVIAFWPQHFSREAVWGSVQQIRAEAERPDADFKWILMAAYLDTANLEKRRIEA